MRYIEYPARDTWTELLQRPSFDVSSLFATVGEVINQVKTGGDEAVKALELKFDGVELDNLTVSEAEFDDAERLVAPELKEAIRLAYNNISTFHQAQRFTPIKVETAPGVVCEQRAVPIEKVGLYVPGGTAPLFSTVLMLATPAKIAGCSEIVLCTPPSRDGSVNPAILFTARLAGVTNVYKVGGSQAIAAMAYGTETVPKVDKIFGPGNQYVTAAKQLVSLSDVVSVLPKRIILFVLLLRTWRMTPVSGSPFLSVTVPVIRICAIAKNGKRQHNIMIRCRFIPIPLAVSLLFPKDRHSDCSSSSYIFPVPQVQTYDQGNCRK